MRWPFPVAPEREFCDFIADREQLRKDVDSLLIALSRQDASSIHLMWSWFGAGKTHTIFYLANRAAELSKGSGSRMYCVYSEFPKAPRSFLDVYRSFSVGLNVEVLVDAFLEISTSADSEQLQREMLLASPDLWTALQVIATGTAHDQVVAMRWLRGEALPSSQFRTVGVSQKIASSEEASRIFSSLVKLLSLAAKSEGQRQCRVIWCLDEFQRIEKLPPRLRDEINTGLHSTFNACATGLSMLLSFSGKPQPKLPDWFSPELRDRIGRTKVMILPPLQHQEALGFVRDILEHLRPSGTVECPAYFPFKLDTCEHILKEVAASGDLRPRAIMHAFNAVLQDADPRIEAKEFSDISVTFARNVLKEMVSLAPEDES